eukprot:gene14360-19693_t
MVVSRVRLAADAMMVCLSHALSTEREEVMGLLVGELQAEGVVEITSLMILTRIDKRKDRVEISAEQLGQASSKAEQMGKECGRELRIIGWYHSHPHITVWPSHVDVRTQFIYQQMDSNFVGLIFSGFHEDPSMVGRIEVTCFQSIFSDATTSHSRHEVPLDLIPCSDLQPTTLQALRSLPESLLAEERELLTLAQETSSKELQVTIHNSAIYTAAICRLLDRVCAPILRVLEERVSRAEGKLEKLRARRDELLG